MGDTQPRLDGTTSILTRAQNNKAAAPRAPSPPSPLSQLGSNPKDIHGYKKVDLSLLPDIAIFHGAHAMVDGAIKYGPYNWRENAVLARVYISAAQRHIKYWAAGQELAGDSGVHHLGHAIACLAILLDAQTTGNLLDNRAKHPELVRAMDALNDLVKARGVTATVTGAKALPSGAAEDEKQTF